MASFIYKGEPYVPNYSCRDCAHLKRNGINVECPCFDHSKIEHYAPWFRSSREKCGFPCKKFYPSKINVFDLKNYWKDYNTWLADWIEEWHNGKMPFDYVTFQIKGQEKECAYKVKLEDYINCDLIDEDGNLKAFQKWYYKQSRKSPIGYEIVYESINGVKI